MVVVIQIKGLIETVTSLSDKGKVAYNVNLDTPTSIGGSLFDCIGMMLITLLFYTW